MEENLSISIANELRKDILRGRLRPGDAIKERDFACKMGVSRTPMREAIRLLGNEGLVELRPSRSPIVANQSKQVVADQIRLLVVLENLSAELACKNATDDDLGRIAGIAETMAAQFDSTDAIDMFEIDMSFHIAVVKASHNGALVETYRTYLQRLWRARFLAASLDPNRKRLIREHRAIVDALLKRDPDAVKNAIQNHLGNLFRDVSNALDREAEERKTSTSVGENK